MKYASLVVGSLGAYTQGGADLLNGQQSFRAARVTLVAALAVEHQGVIHNGHMP
jgi:hypothetical protein